METREYATWLFRGYADAQEGRQALYKRGPDGQHIEPPPVPDEELSDEWQAYLDGWRGFFMDRMAQVARAHRALARQQS